MAEQNVPFIGFNRGLIAKQGLARTDLKRYAMSAEVQTNWMPRVLGSMMLRPGTKYIDTTRSNLFSRNVPFVFSNSDLDVIELTDFTMRVRKPATAGDYPETIVTRLAVSTAITNGTFTTDLTGWTSIDETGAVSSWATGSYMQLVGTGYNFAKRYQQVAVILTDQAVQHAVRIVVAQESVIVRIGTTLGAADLIPERILGVGTHSLAFTPNNASFYVQLQNNVNVNAWVQSVAIEAAGPLTLPTPWPEADLRANIVRHDQSGDIVYLACDGFQQRKILRTLGSDSNDSWSIELYAPQDGPFRVQNVGPITLQASATIGAITLTASEPFFYTGHNGALFKLASIGQHVSVDAAGKNQWSGAAKVIGIGAARTLTINITGTFVGTVVLQQSVGDIGAWTDVAAESWTAPVSTTFLDGFDNQIIYYRIGIEGTYTSGTAHATLDITEGSITGICRITGITSALIATANVMTQPGNTGVLNGLGSTTATSEWWEGQWSDHRGWPTSVAIHEGRMWFAGRDAILGSVSDAYESFDDTVIGDSGPINRTIGSGPVDNINWLLSLQRLLIGAPGAEKSARSSSFDSPLTPTDFIIKDAATQGSANVPPLKIDANGIFVQKTGAKLFQLNYSPNYFMLDYTAEDLMAFNPELGIGGIGHIAAQRQPDTRIHCIRRAPPAPIVPKPVQPQSQLWVAGSSCELLAFNLTDTGNVPPVINIQGALTQLTSLKPPGNDNSFTFAADFDSVGDQYVIQYKLLNTTPTTIEYSVVVFAEGATGNIPPIRYIRGPSTGFGTLVSQADYAGICLDADSVTYVGVFDKIYRIAAGADSNALGTVFASGFGLISSLRYDAVRQWIWVTDFNNSSLLAYDLTGALQRTIKGAATLLSSPVQITIGPDGSPIVIDAPSTAQVFVYGPNVSGNVAPARTITLPPAQSSQAHGIAVDSNARIYAAALAGSTSTLFVYATDASDALGSSPVQTIAGTNTDFDHMIDGSATNISSLNIR